MADDYFDTVKNLQFEQELRAKCEELILKMDPNVANEVKLRYLTHVFAMVLDDTAKILIKPKYTN